jgi:hypothetical protein
MWEAPDDDRPETSWLEKVSDAQYAGPRTRAPAPPSSPKES